MRIESRDGLITFIRDYRYVRYVAAEAQIVLQPRAYAV